MHAEGHLHANAGEDDMVEELEDDGDEYLVAGALGDEAKTILSAAFADCHVSPHELASAS